MNFRSCIFDPDESVGTTHCDDCNLGWADCKCEASRMFKEDNFANQLHNIAATANLKNNQELISNTYSDLMAQTKEFAKKGAYAFTFYYYGHQYPWQIIDEIVELLRKDGFGHQKGNEMFNDENRYFLKITW